MTGVLGVCIAFQVQSQDYKPRSEAEKAMASIENKPILYDSLRRVYKNRWSIGFTYGQRHVENANKTGIPDTVTFTDFTSRKAFYGIEGSYFVSQKVQVFLALNILLLPEEQNINSISIGNNGLQVEGSGNGGAMINSGIGVRYLLLNGAILRPYAGLQVGNIRAIAKGGKADISLFNRNLQIEEVTRNFGYVNPTVGINYRIAPGSMLDLNLGYLKANKTEGIGGVVSPSGVTLALTFHLVINARKD